MLKPTIYIPSKELCLLAARWRAADAALAARLAAPATRAVPAVEADRLVAAGAERE